MWVRIRAKSQGLSEPILVSYELERIVTLDGVELDLTPKRIEIALAARLVHWPRFQSRVSPTTPLGL